MKDPKRPANTTFAGLFFCASALCLWTQADTPGHWKHPGGHPWVAQRWHKSFHATTPSAALPWAHTSCLPYPKRGSRRVDGLEHGIPGTVGCFGPVPLADHAYLHPLGGARPGGLRGQDAYGPMAGDLIGRSSRGSGPCGPWGAYAGRPDPTGKREQHLEAIPLR